MHWYYIAYIIILAATILAFTLLAVYSFKHRSVAGSISFAWFSVLGAWGAFAEAMSFLSGSHAAAHAWYNARFITLAFLPVVWGIFVMQYTGRMRWLTRFRIILLLVVPVITQAMVWTNASHGLWVEQEATIVHTGGFTFVDVSTRMPGPWFWVHTAYAYTFLVVGVVLILSMSLGLMRIYRRQAVAIGFGTLILIAGSAIPTFKLVPEFKVNPVIEVLALSGMIFAWAIFRYRFLDLVPVARDRLVEGIGDAIMAVDARNRVVDLNPAMRHLLEEGYASAGRSLPSALLGMPAETVLGVWQNVAILIGDQTDISIEIDMPLKGSVRYFELHISPLAGPRGQTMGRIVVLHDSTDRKGAEIELQETTWTLGERMKELRCLYGISEIVRRGGISIDDILLETTAIIPQAFQFPEIACAQVTLNTKHFKSKQCIEGRQRLAADIIVNGKKRGAVEVFYVEARGDAAVDMFLPEERDLIDAVAERLGRVIEQRWAENDLRLSEARLDALHTMNGTSFATEKELIEYALEEEVRLTGSEIGYFHFVKDDGVTLDLFAWSSRVMENCTVSQDRHYPLDHAGVWADCVRTRRPAVHNDFAALPGKKGFPEGHSPIIRHASVPVFDGDQIVAVSGVANKPGPYNGQDIRQMELFMGSIWKMVVRRRADEALSRALKEKEELLRKLEASEAELRDRNMRMEFDLKIAQSAQKKFVRDYRPESDRYAVEYRYLPMEKVGGDYFSFFDGKDGAIAFFIGDVSGHGIAAALFVALLKSITDRVFRESPAEPDVYLRKVNDELVDYISSNFITAIYGIFSPDPVTGLTKLKYANGAHARPIVMKANGDCAFHGVGNSLIGVTEDVVFDVNETALERGERVYVLTDGIPETFNANEEMIGFEDGLLGMFARCRRDGLGDTLDAVIEETDRYRGAAPRQDDITLIGFEVL